VLEPEDIQRIVSILDASGARERSLAKAREFCEQADKALDSIDLHSWERGTLSRVAAQISLEGR